MAVCGDRRSMDIRESGCKETAVGPGIFALISRSDQEYLFPIAAVIITLLMASTIQIYYLPLTEVRHPTEPNSRCQWSCVPFGKDTFVPWFRAPTSSSNLSL